MKENVSLFSKIMGRLKGGALKPSLALIISAILMSQAIFVGGTTTSIAAPVDKRSLASEYEQAMREINNIGNMAIRSEQDVRKISTILGQVKGKLRRGHYSYLVIKMAESSSFKQSLTGKLQAEVAKPEFSRSSRLDVARGLYKGQIKPSHRTFYNSDLGRQAVSAIRNQARSDSAAFERAARNLESSLAKLRPNGQVNTENFASPLSFRKVGYATSSPDVAIYDASSTEYASPALVQGWETVLIAALVAAAAIIIAAWANAKAEDITEEDNPDPDGGQRSDFEKCMDEADDKFDRCERRCDNDWWCEAGCNTKWVANAAGCALLPQ